MATILVNVFQSGIVLIALTVVAFWLWPTVRLDSFRQDMFRVRDELFDYAASGKISFQSPAYCLLRQSMNGFIRHGHRLTLFQIVMNALTWKAVGQVPNYVWTKRWCAALEAIPDADVKQDLIKFHERAIVLVSERIVLGSPILWAGAFAFLVITLCRLGWKSATGAFAKASQATTARIIDPRLLDEEAAKAAA